MSRIPQKADEYATAELVRHIDAQMGYFGLNAVRLGSAVGVSHVTVHSHKKNPASIPARSLRAYIRKLELDPVVVLQFLGYSKKEAVTALKKLSYGGEANGSNNQYI